jgi:hypothetical protein
MELKIYIQPRRELWSSGGWAVSRTVYFLILAFIYSCMTAFANQPPVIDSFVSSKYQAIPEDVPLSLHCNDVPIREKK